ncbi:MAG: STAS domain-containing protein [Chitinophagales bacterium]
MKIDGREDRGYMVVTVQGRMDTVTAPNFEKEAGGWIESGTTNMILDLTGLEYISSAGLRSLLITAKKLKGAGGNLLLCQLSEMVKEVICMAGFDSILPIYTDIEEAMKGGA